MDVNAYLFNTPPLSPDMRRAQLTRIWHTYGNSVLGVQLVTRVDALSGVECAILPAVLQDAAREGRTGMQTVTGRPCSHNYYYRKGLTLRMRAELEREGRRNV